MKTFLNSLILKKKEEEKKKKRNNKHKNTRIQETKIFISEYKTLLCTDTNQNDKSFMETSKYNAICLIFYEHQPIKGKKNEILNTKLF